ncbi:HAD family hydrolase [Sulfitobacter sp. D35]|uniref:HAD family hydrolase n=1 Tax=Sulfitobacter sp. D35 TaxID=3083252 RepID=UPI00296EE0D1|nr:HAD family hydrolase [Sulfitobacter sp. D35]MDW4496615.1 HAD family hydrolase [Sulfitobacter sp. D35]
MIAPSAILFDKDGTLFDFKATWGAWAQALMVRLAQGEHEHAARLGDAIGFDVVNAQFAPDSIAIAGTAAEVTEALRPHLPEMTRIEIQQVIDLEAARAPQVEAVPLVPLLGGLRARGLRLGVATNDTEAPARVHLEAAGITGFFDFIAGFDSGHGAKPGPGQLLAFAHACDLAPARIAMVGDSPHDLVAGRAAGMTCVAVLTGLTPRARLAPLADVVLDDVSGLTGWLDSLG